MGFLIWAFALHLSFFFLFMDETTLGQSRVTVKYDSGSEQALKIQKIRDISASLINFLNEDKISRTMTTTVPLD